MLIDKGISPVHSLLFVKSIPSIKFDDSRPASLNDEITWQYSDGSGYKHSPCMSDNENAYYHIHLKPSKLINLRDRKHK